VRVRVRVRGVEVVETASVRLPVFFLKAAMRRLVSWSSASMVGSGLPVGGSISYGDGDILGHWEALQTRRHETGAPFRLQLTRVRLRQAVQASILDLTDETSLSRRSRLLHQHPALFVSVSFSRYHAVSFCPRRHPAASPAMRPVHQLLPLQVHYCRH
jgi:hypothetical protein